MNYLDEIPVVIRAKYGCESRFVRIVPVKEVVGSATLWEGEVVEFDLVGHPAAKKCYAWGYPTDDAAEKREIFAVIDLPPVHSPQTAITFALAAHARKYGAPKLASK
jgi:hypothetical protein